MQKLLFLGFDKTQTRLIELIEAQGWQVDHTQDPITDFSDYDLVVSFGYRHILKAETLATARRPVLNLHISYLPWNRGAHPLFWAAYDGTPVGVTIHEIATGVDTGPICFQAKVNIDSQTETFASGYQRLMAEIQDLFETHAAALLSGSYQSQPQQGAGTMKRVRDLPDGFAWSDPIAPTIQKLKQTPHA